MNVRELIEELEQFDDDMEVGFSYNYGDHAKTMVVESVENMDETEVEWSEYHRKQRVVEESEEDRDEDRQLWVVLSGK